MTDDLAISVGFYAHPQETMFPGIEDGGIRIDIGDQILTTFNLEAEGFSRYTVTGDKIKNRYYYIGENLDSNIMELTDAITTFQRGSYDRYTEIPTQIDGSIGNKVIVLSFCDGEHVRIAMQPVSSTDADMIPTESTVGYPVDPDDLCTELIGCYEDCVTYFESAFGDTPDFEEDVEEVNEWADRQIQRLKNAIETNE